MNFINCERESGGIENKILEVCDRHILVFGEEIQKLLSRLTIGVICVGGLGSILIEQLMRLYPGKLVIIDNDIVEDSNLNRLTNSFPIDAALKVHKVDLMKRAILKFNSGQKITAIHGDFLEAKNQSQFRECDYIFGATDSNPVRLSANRLCLAHGITYFDCGVGANVEKLKLISAGGQVIIIEPGSGFCLHCSGMFNVQEAMNELLPADEKKRLEERGYIKGENITAPQVYSLNMMVASQAVWLFMRMLSGEALNFDGIAIDAKTFKTYVWKEATKRNNKCPTCGEYGIAMGGDVVDLLTRVES
ncbi:MAG: ThiF family adenylyltransferase [Candidatus Zixiibacteriota bacterium]